MKKSFSFTALLVLIILSISFVFIASDTDKGAMAWLQKYQNDSLIASDSVLSVDCTFQQNVDFYDYVSFGIYPNGTRDTAGHGANNTTMDTVQVYAYHLDSPNDAVPVAITNLATNSTTNNGLIVISATSKAMVRYKVEGNIHFYLFFKWRNHFYPNIMVVPMMKKSTYTKYY